MGCFRIVCNSFCELDGRTTDDYDLAQGKLWFDVADGVSLSDVRRVPKVRKEGLEMDELVNSCEERGTHDLWTRQIWFDGQVWEGDLDGYFCGCC